MKKYFFLGIVSFSLIGCANKSVDLMPTPISEEKKLEYSKYSCNQIQNKLVFLEKKARRLARVQNDNARSDRALASWGWILYGVPYFFMEGNGKVKEEFKIILGEKEGLEEILISKDCKFDQSNININHNYENKY